MKNINPIVVLSVVGIALGITGAYVAVYGASKLLAVSLLIPSITCLFRARYLIEENRYRRLLDLMVEEFPEAGNKG